MINDQAVEALLNKYFPGEGTLAEPSLPVFGRTTGKVEGRSARTRGRSLART